MVTQTHSKPVRRFSEEVKVSEFSHVTKQPRKLQHRSQTVGGMKKFRLKIEIPRKKIITLKAEKGGVKFSIFLIFDCPPLQKQYLATGAWEGGGG